MSTAPIVELIEDPREVLYLLQRRKARRRQLMAILVSLTLALGYLGWRVGSHLIASWWLETVQYKVNWGIDRTNWKEGGTTTVNFGRGHGYFYYFGTRPVNNDDLRFLLWLNNVEELNLSYSSNLRDSDLVDLDKLTGLRLLDLDRTRTSAFLQFDPGQLTDATLARIKRLKRLETLNLGGQRITDEGLANLAGLDQLKDLDLRGTAITDLGLEHLKSLRRLTSLDLTGTKVTPQGVQGFEAAFPGVKVLSDPPPTFPRPNPRATR